MLIMALPSLSFPLERMRNQTYHRAAKQNRCSRAIVDSNSQEATAHQNPSLFPTPHFSSTMESNLPPLHSSITLTSPSRSQREREISPEEQIVNTVATKIAKASHSASSTAPIPPPRSFPRPRSQKPTTFNFPHHTGRGQSQYHQPPQKKRDGENGFPPTPNTLQSSPQPSTRGADWRALPHPSTPFSPSLAYWEYKTIIDGKRGR